MISQGEQLEMVTTALVFFFKSQPVMCDSVPQLGHIPRILKAMTARNDAFPKHAIQIVHQLSSSEVKVMISNCRIKGYNP